MDSSPLYAKLPRDYRGFVLSFDGSHQRNMMVEFGGVENSDRCERLPPVYYAHGAEELVIVGDSMLPIQQSLGVIACRKESLMALLNTHKEHTVKLLPVKYLHVVREYNAVADPLATEALESKEERYVHVLAGNVLSPRKTFEKFVTDDNSSKMNTIGAIAVMTRRQAKAKRVRFADEHSEQPPKDQEQSKDRDGVVNEHSPNDISQDKSSSTKRPSSPGADDVDPVEIQRERRRQIAKAQDEEQKWANLKKVLRGEAERMSYKEARNAWKYTGRFVLSEDGVLHYLGLNRRYDHGWQEETKLRLVVLTTMIQEVL
ncbi:hypothetical protein PPTG_07857 [Phytophthora nicotianae INRA-310]|uniref:RNase H type-1 domain-containing protein n=1 Tax=Phytophthora nicotianae (strain INRA-310) TaxID=761204 RepID=W2QM57_PHYN3|nr:hypothetical protein PPTG_07857 [Phytophthora nicotianae INRA-310]ETN14223.1 hypothetical protein PPTG_07857 [Phytophthora nicotianae INRA-310]